MNRDFPFRQLFRECAAFAIGGLLHMWLGGPLLAWGIATAVFLILGFICSLRGDQS